MIWKEWNSRKSNHFTKIIIVICFGVASDQHHVRIRFIEVIIVDIDVLIEKQLLSLAEALVFAFFRFVILFFHSPFPWITSKSSRASEVITSRSSSCSSASVVILSVFPSVLFFPALILSVHWNLGRNFNVRIKISQVRILSQIQLLFRLWILTAYFSDSDLLFRPSR